MAPRTILVPLDLAGNELLNMRLQNLAVDPATPGAGQAWFNTTDDVARYYDGTAVIDIGGGADMPPIADGEVYYGVGTVPTAATPNSAGLVARTGSQVVAGVKTFTDQVVLANSNGAKFRQAGDTSDRGYVNGAQLALGGSGTGVLSWRLDATGNVATLIAGAKIRDSSDPINDNDLARRKFVTDQIATRAPIESPGFTGNPTAPTPAVADNDTSVATTEFVKLAIDALIDAAPGTLDTLNELAAALGDDPNFATTMANAIAAKAGKYAATIGDGAATSYVVTHNLNTRDVVVSVHNASTFAEVEVDIVKTSANTITVTFAVAPALNSYRVSVIG